MGSLLMMIVLMTWALANQFIFLFTNNGLESLVFKKPYILGEAPQILASHMTIIDPKNGDIDVSKLDTITNFYDEICFKFFIFKTHTMDWEERYDNYVKENHGYSNLF